MFLARLEPRRKQNVELFISRSIKEIHVIETIVAQLIVEIQFNHPTYFQTVVATLAPS